MKGSVTSVVELEEAELKRHKCHGGLQRRDACPNPFYVSMTNFPDMYYMVLVQTLRPVANFHFMKCKIRLVIEWLIR